MSRGRGLVEGRLYEVATQCIAELGFGSTSLTKVAQRMGLRREALYHYVASKDEFLFRLVDEQLRAAEMAAEALAGGGERGPAAVLYEHLREGISDILRNPYRSRAMLRSEAYLPSDLKAKYDAARRSIVAALVDLIDDGIKQGAFAPCDPRTAALAIVGMSNPIAWSTGALTDEEVGLVAEKVADLAVHSISTTEGEVPSIHGAVQGLHHVLDELSRYVGEPVARERNR